MTGVDEVERTVLDADGTQTPPSRLAWSTAGVTLTAVLVTCCVAIGLARLLPSRTSATGIADAGPLVELSLSAVKGLFDLSAALTIGWLVAAVVLVPPQRNGLLDVGGYRALHAASLAAMVWAAAGLALVPISTADLGGTSIAVALHADNVTFALSSFEPVRGNLVAALIAVLIAVVARVVLRRSWAGWLLLAAIVAVLPQALSGHSSVSDNHDVAVDTMIYHLVGVSIWVGGLVAFLGLARQKVDHLSIIARRYSTAAGVAFVVVALSGVGNAWVRLTAVSDLWTTPYGRLVVVKATALVVLGVIGFAHRQRTLPSLYAGSRRALVRLASVETVIMAATIGVAAVLGRSAPPYNGIVPPQVEIVLGYNLSGPPTALRLLTDWRFDWIFGTAAIVGAALYLRGVYKLHRRGDSWPVGRTIGWLLGCLVLLISTSSGIGRYSPAVFSIHMIAHMLLAMVTPILLVLGAPVTLALRALPANRDGVGGLREAIVAALHSRLLRLVTHPLFVLPLFVGSFYAIYFTGLFETMISSHFGHVLMNAHFLLVGYLYYWVIIGADPSPRQVSPFIKLGILLGAMPFHAFFGLALMNSHEIMAAGWFGGLGLPWATDLLGDQRTGGAIAWGITELPLLIVLIALLAQWAKTDEREARRDDRRQDTEGNDELASYNRMLAAMAGSREPQAGTRRVGDSTNSTG